MKRFPVGELRLDDKELTLDLGRDKKIFVGSSTDMFADEVSKVDIEDVLKHCGKYLGNTYYFQSKNPGRFLSFVTYLNQISNCYIGTTIESNIEYPVSNAPTPIRRYEYMKMLRKMFFNVFISIEPIMNFDLEVIVGWIKNIRPVFVSIGAESKRNKLIEPNSDKIMALIDRIKGITEVKQKNNLKRLLKQDLK